MSSYYYVKEAIRNVKKHMKDENMEFSKKLSGINYYQGIHFLQLNTDLSWTLQMNV